MHKLREGIYTRYSALEMTMKHDFNISIEQLHEYVDELKEDGYTESDMSTSQWGDQTALHETIRITPKGIELLKAEQGEM